MLPDPPVVYFDPGTRAVDVKFDADFEFTPEAADRIDTYMRACFPAGTFMDHETKYAMEAVATQLQREAFERGEMRLKNPAALAARRQAALDRLKSMPPIMESILAAPLEERSSSFVLVGELKGDYDDFYQRPCEVVAVSKDKTKLGLYRDGLKDHEYVDFRIEDAPDLDEEG
jgi:hypothetical protein